MWEAKGLKLQDVTDECHIPEACTLNDTLHQYALRLKLHIDTNKLMVFKTEILFPSLSQTNMLFIAAEIK